MKTFKYIFPFGVMLLVTSLACMGLQPATPTLPPEASQTSIPVPATSTPEPSPTAESQPQTDYPSRIAYSLFVVGEGIFIHTVDPDGQNDVRLTENDCLGALPNWSPDGSRIAFYCYDAQAEKANLWVMNENGSDARFVAELPDLIDIKWSPDNQYIVYHAPQPDGAENDIYVLDTLTGKVVNITDDSPVWDAFPDWSPNGDLIVFVSDRAENGKSLDDVWVMEPDGSNLVNLTHNGEDWEDYHPSWSPDGKSIAFFRSASILAVSEGGPSGLWVMDADGGNQHLVTAIEGFRSSGAAVWSPDGQYLAYLFALGDNEEVWVVPSAGGEPVNLSNLTGDKSQISWSPDSKALIFTNDNNDQDILEIYIAIPDGTDTHPLLTYERYGFGDWAP